MPTNPPAQSAISRNANRFRIPIISAALLILLMTLSFNRNDRKKAAAPDPATTLQTHSTAVSNDWSWGGGFPITEVDALLDDTHRRQLVGRRVELTGMQIQQVLDENSFTIGSAPDSAVLVVTGQPLMSQSIDVRNLELEAGQFVSLFGQVKQWFGGLYIEAQVLEIDEPPVQEDPTIAPVRDISTPAKSRSVRPDGIALVFDPAEAFSIRHSAPCIPPTRGRATEC